MKNFITYLIFFSLLLFSCSEKENSSTPNIVIIFMDDMGYGDISNFGAINYKTPNLDKLVNNGMLGMAMHGMLLHVLEPESCCSARSRTLTRLSLTTHTSTTEPFPSCVCFGAHFCSIHLNISQSSGVSDLA